MRLLTRLYGSYPLKTRHHRSGVIEYRLELISINFAPAVVVTSKFACYSARKEGTDWRAWELQVLGVALKSLPRDQRPIGDQNEAGMHFLLIHTAYFCHVIGYA